MDVLQCLEVTLAELGVEVPIANLPLAREGFGRLQFGGPDGAVGELGRRDGPERQRRVTRRITKTHDAVHRSVRLPARFLAKDVSMIIEDVASKTGRSDIESV